MARYSAPLQRTASTTQSVGTVAAGATARRGKIYDVVLGSEAAPANNAFLWKVQRCTAAGTSTAVTPVALDEADAACVAAAGQNHSVEPTYSGVSALLVGLNQQNTFRWQAAPGRELVWAATTGHGFGLSTPTSSAVVVSADVHFEEQ